MADPLRTDKLSDGNSEFVVKFAKVDLSASGDVVALVALKKIRVIAASLVASATFTAKWQTGAATDLTGAMSMITGVPLVWNWNPNGWMETAAGAKLNLVLAGTGTVAGTVAYIEV